MAYSDYGGYAYRNGKRVVDRSDATITPTGDTYGTPGSYPGFALMAAGVPHEEVMRRADWPSGHAVLGDGPIYVVLRKQWATIHHGPLRLHEVGVDLRDEDDDGDDLSRFFEIDGHKIDVVLTHEDNFYVYARIAQPDGTVWHGWSGYGVGAGLEDCGYGYSTSDRDKRLLEMWPEAICPDQENKP